MAGDYPTTGFTHPLSEAPASSTRRRIRLDVAFDPLECGPHASDVGPAAGSPQNCPVDSVRPTGVSAKDSVTCTPSSTGTISYRQVLSRRSPTPTAKEKTRPGSNSITVQTDQ